MSTAQYLSNDTSQRPYQHTDDDHDYKVPFDELTDEYSTPYAPTSHHQTYAVGAQMQTSHRRGNSTPMKNIAFASKQSEDTIDSDMPSYPPNKQAKEVDTRTLWEKVRVWCSQNSTIHPSFSIPDTSRITGLSAICCRCAGTDNNRPRNRRRTLSACPTALRPVRWQRYQQTDARIP
jgi:hypothetical protein